jgi:D-alanine-D-alanine ligase
MQNATLTVAIVCGGTSSEADVSRKTGRGVYEAAHKTYSNCHLLEFTPDIAVELKALHVDVVFPALHGRLGEDGCIQGLLEVLGIAYVGSGVLGSALAMSKHTAKKVFTAAGIPVPPGIDVECGDANARTAVQRFCEQTPGPYVVKPSAQGSAIGVHFCPDADAILLAMQEVAAIDSHVVVEKRIIGRELTVAVLDDGPALPPIEIRTAAGSWYDFEHRYTVGWSDHVIPADISARQSEIAVDLALRAHQALECRDLSRVDMLVPEQGAPYVLEVNTMPGMTSTSLFPDAAAHAGIDFDVLVARLIARAAARRKPA